jgi:hypothetical protein
MEDDVKRPQLAVIAPISLQVNLDLKYGLMGDYHLLLAHQVLANRQVYFDYYMALRRSGRDPVVIMDNSLVELGRALPADRLVEACVAVGARYLVLPDVMGDAFATVDKSMLAYRRLKDTELPEGLEFMIVLQGNTLSNAGWCMNQLTSGMGRDLAAICVPRVMTHQFGSRLTAVKMVSKETGLPIHLLGFSGKLSDDIISAFQPGVMGIDSAYPVWSGRLGIAMQTQGDYDPETRRPADFWEYQHIAPTMIYNIMKFREWFKQ